MVFFVGSHQSNVKLLGSYSLFFNAGTLGEAGEFRTRYCVLGLEEKAKLKQPIWVESLVSVAKAPERDKRNSIKEFYHCLII